jgi:hypothetical protein
MCSENLTCGLTLKGLNGTEGVLRDDCVRVVEDMRPGEGGNEGVMVLSRSCSYGPSWLLAKLSYC